MYKLLQISYRTWETLVFLLCICVWQGQQLLPLTSRLIRLWCLPVGFELSVSNHGKHWTLIQIFKSIWLTWVDEHDFTRDIQYLITIYIHADWISVVLIFFSLFFFLPGFPSLISIFHGMKSEEETLFLANWWVEWFLVGLVACMWTDMLVSRMVRL